MMPMTIVVTNLTVDDIVKLDNACTSHKYRSQVMEKINGMILIRTLIKPLSCRNRLVTIETNQLNASLH